MDIILDFSLEPLQNSFRSSGVWRSGTRPEAQLIPGCIQEWDLLVQVPDLLMAWRDWRIQGSEDCSFSFRCLLILWGFPPTFSRSWAWIKRVCRSLEVISCDRGLQYTYSTANKSSLILFMYVCMFYEMGLMLAWLASNSWAQMILLPQPSWVSGTQEVVHYRCAPPHLAQM